MPDFRYFELFNLATKPSEGVDITIFPWLKDSDNTLVYDGSAKDSTNGVATERCCHENTSKTVNDTEHLWTYNLKSSGTAVGRYYGEGKFSIEDPKPLTLRENAAALPDSYYIINSPAVAKLLVALGGVISPQMN